MDKYTKTSLIIIILSSILILFGAYLKLQKISQANYIIGWSLIIEIIVGGMLLIHLFKNKPK